MIMLKNKLQLDIMREAGRISARALRVGLEAVRPGVTNRHIDKVIHDYIKRAGAIPSFLGYGGFPAAACISVNEQVIHGVPGDRVIKEGDIVSIDVGAIYQGFHGDNAATVGAGRISEEAKKLLEVTRESLKQAIKQAVIGNRVGDIGHAVQAYAAGFGYGVVREYVGHGVGRDLHESPEVPNYGPPGRGVRLSEGMTLAIEPMVNLGKGGVRVLSDGNTVVTRDGSLSAHFEHTVAITADGPEILTLI